MRGTHTDLVKLENIHQLAASEYGKHFLVRSYSIELLLYLLEYGKAEGIEDLLHILESATPKLPAFLSYISLLEMKNCVTKIPSKKKRSKRLLMLTNECDTAIRHILY